MTDEMKLVNCGCGGEAIVAPFHGDGYESFYVYCQKCNIDTDYYEFEAEAIEAWNRAMTGSCEKCNNHERTAKVETVEKPNVFKCSECGQYFHSTAWGSPVEYCSRCGCKLDWNEDIPMEYFESGGI